MLFSSAVKDASELSLFHGLLTDRRVVVQLFNEACINSAWSESTVELGSEILNIISGSTYLGVDIKTNMPEVNRSLNLSWRDAKVITRLNITRPWHEAQSTLVDTNLHRFTIRFLSDEEGSQQEQLAAWLTDGLSPESV
jgi:hypothetical protein